MPGLRAAHRSDGSTCQTLPKIRARTTRKGFCRLASGQSLEFVTVRIENLAPGWRPKKSYRIRPATRWTRRSRSRAGLARLKQFDGCSGVTVRSAAVPDILGLVDPGGFITKGKSKGTTAVDRAAEAVGHALGNVAGTIDSLQAQHPHPVEEAREALVAGQEAVAAVASKVGTGAAAVIKQAKAVARRTKKAATRAGRKSRPTVARVTGAARTVVKRARKAVTQGRKTVKRAAARLKR